jgi:hypothetical protein
MMPSMCRAKIDISGDVNPIWQLYRVAVYSQKESEQWIKNGTNGAGAMRVSLEHLVGYEFGSSIDVQFTQRYSSSPTSSV